MRRLLAGSISLLAFAGLLSLRGLPWWALALAFVGVALVGWQVGKCPHAGPLGLLPASATLDGTPLPPRWYCDACGRTWPAVFERAHPPILKYSGYDEGKAVLAARRADELAQRHRELALHRAGPRGRRARAADAPEGAASAAAVVSIRPATRMAR